MPPTVKKVLVWLVVGFFIYAIITNSDQAADIVHAGWDIISQAVLNISRFFSGLMT